MITEEKREEKREERREERGEVRRGEEPLGSLLGPLGASWGDLGPSWGEIVCGTLDFFNYFLERF